MFCTKPLGKSQTDRLVEIEDQLLYLSEVLDRMRLLESRMSEIDVKVNRIDELADRLETMPVCELMVRIEALEDKAITSGGFENGDSSTSTIVLVKKCIEGFDNDEQVIV